MFHFDSGVRMRERVRALVDSRGFKCFVMALICLNAFTIGLQTFNLPAGLMKALVLFDGACLAIYVVEAVLKIYAYRCDYFKSKWNIFDFVIVLVCLVPIGSLPLSPQVARSLRIIRFFKSLRLVSGFSHMRVIVDALGRSIPGVVWTAVLLLIVHYVFAIIGIDLFRNDFPQYFGTLGGALFTLFQCATLEGWPDIARTIMDLYPGAWAYFFLYIVIAAFIIVNIVVGIVVNAVEESQVHAEVEAYAEEELGSSGQLRAELVALKKQIAVVEALLDKEEEK